MNRISRADPGYNFPHSYIKTEWAVEWTTGEIWQLGYDEYGKSTAYTAYAERNRETGTPDSNSNLGFIERIMNREVVTTYREWTIHDSSVRSDGYRTDESSIENS